MTTWSDRIHSLDQINEMPNQMEHSRCLNKVTAVSNWLVAETDRRSDLI